MAMHSTNTAIQRSTKVAAKKKKMPKMKKKAGELIDMDGAKKSKQTDKQGGALKEHLATDKHKKSMMFGGGSGPSMKKAPAKKKATKKK